MTKSVITCMEPGCTCLIPYDLEQESIIPAYYPLHRTETGKHSLKRKVTIKKDGSIQTTILPASELPSKQTRRREFP